jgi:Fe-S-cluster containining protein
MLLPDKIKDFLKEKQSNASSPCTLCNAACCYGPGFAILENVELIYQAYVADKLIRDDHVFEPGLTLSQFIYKYFDRVVFKGDFLVFFPKFFSANGELLSIPPWNYYDAREYVRKRHGSNGCVFLRKKQDENDPSANSCILHDDNFDKEITKKPIDCLFLHCSASGSIAESTVEQGDLWFALLNYMFPNSTGRFKQLCPDIADE